MGSVVTLIQNVVAIVVTILALPTLVVTALVQTAFGGSFEAHMSAHLEFIFGLFGLHGENMISTNVTDNRMLGDDYQNLMTQVALIHQDTQMGIIDIMKQNTLGIVTKYNKYFTYGRDQHYSGLPTCNIDVGVFPTQAVVAILNTTYGVNAEIFSSKTATPTKEEYVHAMLRDSNAYNMNTNTLMYTGVSYTIDYIEYNFLTNNYDVHIYLTGTPTTTAVISIVAFGPYAYYVVVWNQVGSGNYSTWIYKLGSGNATLDTGVSTTNTDMLPIIEIRNNGININGNPTSTKYLQAKEILETIGLDVNAVTTALEGNPSIANVMDAFIYFGLDVSDTSPTVSKLLFHTFDYVFTKGSVFVPEGNFGGVNEYRISVTEGNYNSAVAWTSQSLNYVADVIGPVGTYKTEILGSTLVLKHQNTESHYREYRMTEIFTVSCITRGGLVGVVTKTLLSGPMTIPLSYNFVNQMSPIEQMEIFCKSLRISAYAAEVTHLAYYQTSSFSQAVQIIMIVAVIVVSVLSGGSLAEIAVNFAIGLASSYAIKKILESNAPEWLKAILVIVAVAIAAYVGNYNQTGEWLSPEQIGDMVTNYASSVGTMTGQKMAEYGTTAISGIAKIMEYRTAGGMADLQQSMNAFSTEYEDRMKELSDLVEGAKDYLSTEFVEKLANTDVAGFMEGPAVNYYKAIGMQYDQVYLTVGSVYENIYDYDKHYRIGIVNLG